VFRNSSCAGHLSIFFSNDICPHIQCFGKLEVEKYKRHLDSVTADLAALQEKFEEKCTAANQHYQAQTGYSQELEVERRSKQVLVEESERLRHRVCELQSKLSAKANEQTVHANEEFASTLVKIHDEHTEKVIHAKEKDLEYEIAFNVDLKQKNAQLALRVKELEEMMVCLFVLL
jgi:chromosome segregation ATPase